VLQFQAQIASVFPAAQAGWFMPVAVEEINDVLVKMKEHAKMRIKPRWVGGSISAVEDAILRQPPDRRCAIWASTSCGWPNTCPRQPPVTTSWHMREACSMTRSTYGYVTAGADFVAHAVEQAQHVDRIPLDPDHQRATPQIDVLVPSQLGDLAPLYVRPIRGSRSSGAVNATATTDRTERVVVYVVDADKTTSSRLPGS
jgi:hypothetical protein